MESLTDQLLQATNEIQAHLDALAAEAQTLRGQWSGEAQTAYDRAHKRWTTQMEQMRAGLALGAATASAAHTIMRNTESAAAALWR